MHSKWAFMPQSAWGQGSALKSLRPSHGCWFHPQTERASQQDTASLLFSSHSLIASLWQVKCQEPGRGGVWRRRDKRFSPSINLKTYSADNLNGTGISFSMETRDGRRLGEKKRERVQTQETWCWRRRESCKLCNFSLLCKLHAEERKALSLPAVPWPRWGVLSASSVLMWGEEIPYSAPVLPRGKTNAFWTLEIWENCRLLPPRKQNCLKGKRYYHSLYSTSCLQTKGTDADSVRVPALTTHRSAGLASLSLSALHLTWKKMFVTSAMPNHLDAQIKTRHWFILFQGTPKWSMEADKLKIRAAPLPVSRDLMVSQFLLTFQAWPSSELFSCYFTFITWAVTARMRTTGKLHLDSCTFVFQAGPMQLLKRVSG